MKYEGDFWYIDDKVVAPLISKDYCLTRYNHSNIWSLVSDRYRVDGKLVPYDYYPRGTVIVIENNNKSKIYVFGDTCLNTDEIKEKIADMFEFRGMRDVEWCMSDKFVHIHHYTCN